MLSKRSAANCTLFLLSDGARRVIGEHILSYVHHLEGFGPISGNFEGFVDNITNIWSLPLGVILNFV